MLAVHAGFICAFSIRINRSANIWYLLTGPMEPRAMMIWEESLGFPLHPPPCGAVNGGVLVARNHEKFGSKNLSEKHSSS